MRTVIEFPVLLDDACADSAHLIVIIGFHMDHDLLVNAVGRNVGISHYRRRRQDPEIIRAGPVVQL